MNFSFCIPSSTKDLLNSEGDNYYVKQVYSSKETPDALKSCKQAALSGDPFYIFDHFDTYFSIIINAKELTLINITRAFDLLFMTTDKLGNQLQNLLKNESLLSNDRHSYLNCTKMTLFLIIKTVQAVDNILQRSQLENCNSKKSKKTWSEDGLTMQDWGKKRFSFLVQLYNLMQLSLEKLWSPPIAEENFVNILCDVAYSTLESENAKERNVGDTVFQILGTAIKKFNHAISFPIKILQILRTNESSVIPTAHGVQLLSEEFGITSIFSILIKEIVDALSVDSADSQIAKNFSSFLTELATIAPKLIIPHLSTLGEELLNLDSYVLRNCVLQIMGDILSRELTGEDLPNDLKETRDEFLEDLLAHINDTSAHVRSKVLQIWNHIKEDNAVPLIFQHRVLMAGVERLEDKTSSVRKNAIILIKSFLERNPFAPTLTLEELIKRYEEENEKLDKLREIMLEENKKVVELEKQWDNVIPDILPVIKETLQQSTQELMNSQQEYEDLVPLISGLLVEKKYKEAVSLVKQADYVAGNAELRQSLTPEEQCLYYLTLLKSYLFLGNGCKDRNEEFVTQENTVKFLDDSIEFSKTITSCVPKIQEMLMSKTNTDVFEAVDFFTTAYLFGIKETEGGMRQMLYLVWSGDKEKCDAVLNAYKRILFTTEQQGRLHSVKVVKNLCNFFDKIDCGQYSAMEILMKKWVENGDIDLQIIQVMFERFTMKLEETTENESRQALQLLIMASSAKSSIATANISIIENIGFGERAIKDPRLYASCLSFLQNSVPSNSNFYKRYEENNIIVQNVVLCFKKFFFHPKLEDFDNIAMRTIEFFYQLCQAPDVICHRLIQDLHSKMKKIMITVQNLKESQTTELENDSQSTDSVVNLPVFLLSRFLFVVGFTTMKEMIFLDIDVYNNLKFRQELKEETKNLQKKTNNKRKTVNMDMSASESLKRLSGTTTETSHEPDEELVGATAEDSIAELINHICENELLYSSAGILPKIASVVIEICKHPSKYKNENLQQAASLALIRFMSVSSKFCETHMPFLMNILNLTKNIKIKCNIVVGLSDLTFRFPNVIEPWTGHFYSTLHESNDELRLTAVKMLSHLILHEMIRVKGQIAELALCIIDPVDEIKNITQHFFKEIANKSNILYNVLPDIISKLSNVNLNLEEEKYHTIMKYILGLIQKDRQVGSLIEKLCLRFSVTTEPRQWRDIAFCLSLLNYTEKTIKKLTDNIQHFKDKVQIDEVHHSFKTIISNASKLAKPELKAAITEFENRLAECFQTDDDIVMPSGNDGNNQQKNKGSVRKTNSRKKRRGRRGSSEASSSTDDFCENEEAVTQQKVYNKNTKSRNRNKKTKRY